MITAVPAPPLKEALPSVALLLPDGPAGNRRAQTVRPAIGVQAGAIRGANGRVLGVAPPVLGRRVQGTHRGLVVAAIVVRNIVGIRGQRTARVDKREASVIAERVAAQGDVAAILEQAIAWGTGIERAVLDG